MLSKMIKIYKMSITGIVSVMPKLDTDYEAKSVTFHSSWTSARLLLKSELDRNSTMHKVNI